jgi:predicted enzyme related to lactoylglutathione lyase
MCLHTTDIERDYRDLSAKGVKFLTEPKKLPGTAVSIVCCKDPDGTFVELLEGDF